MKRSKLKATVLLITPLFLMACSSGNEMVSNYYEDGIYFDESFNGSLSASSESDYNTPGYNPLSQSSQEFDYYDPQDNQTSDALSTSAPYNSSAPLISQPQSNWSFGVGMGMGYTSMDMMYSSGYGMSYGMSYGMGYGMGYGSMYSPYGPGFGYPGYGPGFGYPGYGPGYGYCPPNYGDGNGNRINRTQVNGSAPGRSQSVSGGNGYTSRNRGGSSGKTTTQRDPYTPYNRRSATSSERVVRTSQGNYKKTETRSNYSPQKSNRQRSNSYGVPSQKSSTPQRTRKSKSSSEYSSPNTRRGGSRSSGGSSRSSSPSRSRR